MGNVKVLFKGKRLEIAEEAYLIDSRKPSNERKYTLALPVNEIFRNIMFENSKSVTALRNAIEKHIRMAVNDESLGGLIYRCFGDYRDFHTLMSGDIFMLGVKESGKDVSEFLSNGAMRDIVHTICYQDEVILKEIFHAHTPLSYDSDTVSVRLPIGSYIETSNEHSEIILTHAVSMEIADSLNAIKTHITPAYHMPSETVIGVGYTHADGVFILNKDDYLIYYTELKYVNHMFKYRNKTELFATKIQVSTGIRTYNYELGEYELKPYWFKIKVPEVGGEKTN